MCEQSGFEIDCGVRSRSGLKDADSERLERRCGMAGYEEALWDL